MTDEEKAEEYAIKITDELRNKGFLTNEEIDQRYAGIVQGVLYGLAEGRKNCMTVQNAMETIKRYCKEITDENNNCSKCIFCSKGFNGCKLQRAPCEWELSE
ncbi:hypothetical protein [Treponema sp.]|uniref:hypothetical protein n=1 Tax=Treponema sp. TaxID=166 RepID=UPI00298EB8D1|nr:hypothetical protein [Treponema sp.]MCQ2242044.1 hypothetical protein [Treponema sp.]